MPTLISVLTGRQRRISYTSTLAGEWAQRFEYGIQPEPDPCDPEHEASGILSLSCAFGPTVYCEPWARQTDPIPPACFGNFQAGTKVRAISGYGATDGFNEAVDDTFIVYSFDPVCPDPGACHQWEQQWEGTAELWCDAEEVMDYEYWGPGDPPDANQLDGWARYGGVSAPGDMPPYTVIRFRERARIGGTVGATITAGGASATAQTTITSGNQFNIGSYSWQPSIGYNTVGGGGSISATCDFQGVPVTTPLIHSKDNAVHSTGDGVSVTHSGDTLIQSGLAGTMSPVKGFEVTGNIRAMENTYPDTLGIKVQKFSGPGGITNEDITGGAIIEQYDQARYAMVSTINGTNKSAVIDEWTDQRQYCRVGTGGDGDPYSLLALDEDASDWRILHRSRRWNVFTLSQVMHVLFNGQTTSGWTGMGVNFSLEVEGMKLSCYGNPGVATWVPPALKRNWQSSRYLRIIIKGDAPQLPGLTIKVNNKEWVRDRYGEPLTVNNAAFSQWDIDLCGPTNADEDVDSKDSRWPFPTEQTDMWGIALMSALEISGLSPGHDYIIDDIQLLPLEKVGATFLPSFDNWIEASVGDTSSYKRFLETSADGRLPSIEEMDVIRTEQPSGEFIYTYRTIQNLIDDINAIEPDGSKRYLGVLATPAGSMPDAMRTLDRFATMCMGAGILFSPTVGYGFDRDIYPATSLQVVAQLLADAIEWYPECGDAQEFDTSEYGGRIPLRVGKALRSQAVGGVLDETSMAVNQGDVKVKRTSTGQPAGSAVTDTHGSYQSGLPYPKGLLTHTVTSESGEEPFLSNDKLFRSRYRHRAWFKPPVEGGGPWNLEDRNGRYHRAFSVDGIIRYWRSSTARPYAWEISGARVTSGKNPRMTIDFRGQVILVFARGDRSYEITSDDYGDTWGAEKRI